MSASDWFNYLREKEFQSKHFIHFWDEVRGKCCVALAEKLQCPLLSAALPLWSVRALLQVWTNYIFTYTYIYTHRYVHKNKKIRVHTCSTEKFSFLTSKYFWRFCTHLALLEHLLNNRAHWKKSHEIYFSPAILLCWSRSALWRFNFSWCFDLGSFSVF